MPSLKKFTILIIFFILTKIAHSQPVTVSFIYKSDNISTVMTGLSDSQLITTGNPINLDEILGLHFSETLPDSATLQKLVNLDFYIYLKNIRQKIKVKDNVLEFDSKFSIGFGLGLDYGGFGIKASLFPAKPIGVFLGAGFNTEEIGYNVGIDWKLNSKKRTSAFAAIMYGYNAVSNIDQDKGKKTFYGLSGQIGARMRAGRADNYLSLGLILPITRDSEFKSLKKTYGNKLEYFPVLFSIGFNFGQ